MTCNIIFCGGCNPHYDRRAFAESIRAAYPEIAYTFNAETDTDIVLILCGCSTACVNVPEEYGSRGRLKICSADMLDRAVSFFDRMMETESSCSLQNADQGKEKI